MEVRKDRLYRSMTATLLPSTSEQRLESDYYVEGIATRFNQPYLLWEWDGIKYYEEIDRNALSGADVSDVIMQYDHAGRVLARMSNKTLGIDPTDNDLVVFADLSKSNAARDMYNDIKEGLVTKMSWAFTVAEESFNKETRTRKILKVKKVYDVSAVSIPANNATEISARAYVDGVIERERQEFAKRLDLAKRKYHYLRGL